MKIANLLDPDLILSDCKATDPVELLDEIIHRLKDKNKITNEKTILKKLMDREKLGSTSIGNHSAVPHTKLKELKEPIITIAISKTGVMYHPDDKEPVHLIILILSPNNSPIIHLQILAAAAALIKKSKSLMPKILSAVDPHDSIRIIREYEELNE